MDRALLRDDNQTLIYKLSLRRRLLTHLTEPVVLETHGGWGTIYQAVYSHLTTGVVIEKDEAKVDALVEQRPTWGVFQADSIKALADGLGRHLPVNFFDIDPYGSAWRVLEAIFASERPWPDRLVLAVNDGARNNTRMGGAWRDKAAVDAVAHYGNDAIFANYLPICREVTAGLAAARGYEIAEWTGYYCGRQNNMTHYGVVLEKTVLERAGNGWSEPSPA